MTLYITRNGQQLGPYSLEETQGQVRAGTLSLADYAWYEGQPTWIPLAQVPGFAAVDAPWKRSALFWIISILYFIYIFCSLINLALIPIMTHWLHSVDSSRPVAAFLSSVDYGLAILTLSLSLTGASLLLWLKRPALYFLAAAFLVRIATLIYNIVAKDSWHVIGRSTFTMSAALFVIVIIWGINLAVLGYTWHLARAKVLR